jgi:hypothetical protein
MNKGLKLNTASIQALLSKTAKRYSKHAAFAAILVVLLVYILVVFKVNSLAKVEPAAETPANSNLIPKVNQKSIDRIQSLEQNNTEIHSLFEEARNNPFQE